MPLVTFDCYEELEAIQVASVFHAARGLEICSIATGSLPVAPTLSSQAVLALLPGLELTWAREEEKERHLTLKGPGRVLSVSIARGTLTLTLLMDQAGAREQVLEYLKNLEPHRCLNKADEGVWCDFAHWSCNRTQLSKQFLRAPAWPDIRGNYPRSIQTSLDRLTASPEPWKVGRLVLWHGPPGTGKTYAVRALMMAWRERFDFCVINDPEHFAKEPGYYYSLASQSQDRPEDDEESAPTIIYRSHAVQKPKRKLFILEDAADLILQESRSMHYDKIGKLLNMTDGLFGQGREDLFLLTFNEAVARIDPAFTRPGRCAGLVEFEAFPAEEAGAWLRTREAREPAVEVPLTLAELFERLRNPGIPQARKRSVRAKVGFGG